MSFMIPKIIKEDPSVHLIVELDKLDVTYRHGVALAQFIEVGYQRIVKIETMDRTLYILGCNDSSSTNPVVALSFSHCSTDTEGVYFAIRPTANLLLNMMHGYRTEEYHSMYYVDGGWRSSVNGLEGEISHLAMQFTDCGMSDTEEVIEFDHDNAMMAKHGFTEIFDLSGPMICKIRKVGDVWKAVGGGQHPHWSKDLERAWFRYSASTTELCFVEKSIDGQYAFYGVGSTISHVGTVGNYIEHSELVVLKEGLAALDEVFAKRTELKNELIELSKPKVIGAK